MPEKRVRLRQQWKPEDSIADLPPSIRECFQDEALNLLRELQWNRLEVKLHPAPIKNHHSHKIRVAENHNPPWYSKLYETHQTDTHRSNVKRVHVRSALAAIAEAHDLTYSSRGGSKAPGRNYRDLREIIYKRLIHGYNDPDGFPYDPNNKVRRYFGLEPVRDDDTPDDIPF